MTSSFWQGKVVLITGGTGSLGTAISEQLLDEPIAALRILSRDEHRQAEWLFHDHPSVRMLIGDVRDGARYERAARGVDVLIHAAALKRADAIEYNGPEAVETNVRGASNAIDAAVRNSCRAGILVSSDKAVRPANIYGATKLIAESFFLRPYTGAAGPAFSVCRFGNFLGSRGSVLPMWREQRRRGYIEITDARMTRFVITLRDAAAFVVRTAEHEKGGLHVPRMRSLYVRDLAEAVADGAEVREVGARVGEKLHEELGDGTDSSQGPHMTVEEIRMMLRDEVYG